MEEKHKRYLRCVREQVNEDAQSCIDIVNRYIEKKQQCLPLSYIIFHWLLGHAYELAGLLIVALIVAYKEKSLLTVAVCACAAVFIAERIMEFIM